MSRARVAANLTVQAARIEINRLQPASLRIGQAGRKVLSENCRGQTLASLFKLGGTGPIALFLCSSPCLMSCLARPSLGLSTVRCSIRRLVAQSAQTFGLDTILMVDHATVESADRPGDPPLLRPSPEFCLTDALAKLGKDQAKPGLVSLWSDVRKRVCYRARRMRIVRHSGAAPQRSTERSRAAGCTANPHAGTPLEGLQQQVVQPSGPRRSG